ncbi:MAG: hypothetical protein QXS54_00475 [Candidatus Methanomethylicaceae archaeon]
MGWMEHENVEASDPRRRDAYSEPVGKLGKVDALKNESFDPSDLYYQLLECGTRWAEAQAAYDLLYETKKIVIANLKNQSQAKSDAAKENDALSHPDYMDHVVKMHKAAREAMQLRVRYESLKIYADLLRSKIALKRAEMGLV